MKQISLEEVKNRLCQQAWALSEPCNPSLLTSLLHSAHEGGGGDIIAVEEDDQGFNSGPILYILVVAAFYLSIIGLIVRSNKIKSQRNKNANSRAEQVVEYAEGQGAHCRLIDTGRDTDEDEIVMADKV